MDNGLLTDAMAVPKLFDLTSKTAVVTGAGGGLGEGIAMAFASAGANVALVDLKPDRLGQLADVLKDEFGRGASCHAVDISDEAQVAAMVREAIGHHGSLDILVNCAGVAALGPALEMSLDEWRKGIKVNLEGTFICCREAGRQMIEAGGGKIVNISSVRGTQGRSGYTSYAPSKAGVNLLTKSLAIEWAEHNVKVNAIAPIFIRTTINAHILDDPDKRREIIGRIPVGRLGQVRDLFGAVIYLASPASDFVTGTVLYVDGGWTAA